jgi:hypothetical protein
MKKINNTQVIVDKLKQKHEINLLFTNFKKEIKITKQKLEKCVCLKNYYNRNHLFELKKIAKKKEQTLLKWLVKLNEGQKEYLTLL